MRIIACDPGVAKPSAFAIFANNELYGTFKGNNMQQLLAEFQTIDKLIIEDQFLGLNTKTLKDLTRQSGKIIGIAELSNMEVEIVMPTVWQSYFKIARKPKGLTAYHWKKVHAEDIIKKAEELTGWKFTADDDTASAVLIGLYGVQNETK